MAAEKLKLIRERTQVRRLFSRAISEIQEIMIKDVKLETIVQKYKYITEKKCALDSLDMRIKDLLLSAEDYNQEEYEDEVDVSEKYIEKYIEIQLIYEKLNKRSEETPTHKYYSLPKIEVFKFNDDPKTWIQFWGQFKKIHEDHKLDGADKFQYLIQSLADNSNARELVQSYPPSSENYTKAVEQLQSRFGKTEVLIEIYIRELLGIVLAQARGEQTLTLRALYDRLTTYLQALESLGIYKDKYDALLFPLIESAVSESVLLAWNRSQYFRLQGAERLSELLKFLDNEVNAEERIKMARSSSIVQEKALPSLNCFTTESNIKVSKEKMIQSCLFCDKSNHNTIECSKAGDLSIEVKKDIIKKKGNCYICLKRGHMAIKCKSYVKCIICKKRHLAIMCPQINCIIKKESVNLCINKTTLLQTLLVNITNKGKTKQVRALLDSGSQRSYIKSDIIDELGLDVIAKEVVSHTLFGGIEREAKMHRCVKLKISAIEKSFQMDIKALEQNTLCGILPKVTDKKLIENLHKFNIKLTDMESHIEDISLLIGADYLGSIITNDIVHMENNLCAMKTRLGWTLQGPTTSAGTYHTTVLQSQLANNNDISDLWSLELLGIQEPQEEKELKDTIRTFEENIKKNKDGRYEVSLLWKNDLPTVSTNYALAYKRLLYISKKLKRMEYFQEYNNILLEWENLGIIEEVKNDNNEGHYLPHHPIIKMSSNTTKVRPVFDASAKDNQGWSLNDCIDKGSNMMEMIPKLLINFRLGRYGVTADIKKAFLNIALKEEDTEYLKFLWWKDTQDDKDNLIKIYKHKRVVFGIKCSPFLLAATINYHLKNYTEEYANTAKLLNESFYVDNCVTSFDDLTQMNTFVKEAKKIMQDGGFDLCEWATAPRNVNDRKVITVLGMLWNTSEDSLRCNINLKYDNLKENISKRKLLSITHQIFDPLGLMSPVTLLPKLIIQKAWLCNRGWGKAIIWKFIPPGAPWWGGWWERLIRVVKEMLLRILGKSSITWIELSTVLCDCEAVINSRPLTYITTDDDALKPLTPQMFIQTLPGSENADLDHIDGSKLGLRYGYLQKLREDFRSRFKNEYLALLVNKGGQSSNRYPQVGDVVLIETNEKRLNWPLGVIRELYTGKDGFNRVAKLQTANGDKVRAVQKLYPLELKMNSEKDIDAEKMEHVTIPSIEETIKKSRHGRLIKIPRKLLD